MEPRAGEGSGAGHGAQETPGTPPERGQLREGQLRHLREEIWGGTFWEGEKWEKPTPKCKGGR